MNITTIALVLFGIASNASASVLIKYAMMPERKVTLSDPFSIISNIPLWSGLVLYGVAFLLYAFTLQKLPLNVAHPVLTGGAIAAVAMMSLLIFGETFAITKIIGLILLVISLFLISWNI